MKNIYICVFAHIIGVAWRREISVVSDILSPQISLKFVRYQYKENRRTNNKEDGVSDLCKTEVRMNRSIV